MSQARGERILAAADGDPGTMAAVSAEIEVVRSALADCSDVVIANHNAPRQIVISGPTSAVEEAVEKLGAAGLRAKTSPVACAFHSPVVARARELFADDLAAASVGTPDFPVWSNTTAEPHVPEPDAIRAQLAEHVARPVRWVDQIESMYEAGARIFVEVGAGQVLSNLVGKILGARPHLKIATDKAGEPGIPTLLGALATLAVHGVEVDPTALFDGRNAHAFDLSAPPDVGLRPSTWLVTGQVARPLVGEPPEGAFIPIRKPIVGVTLPGSPVGDRDRAAIDFLRNS